MHHYCGNVEPLKTKAKHTVSLSAREASPHHRHSRRNGLKSSLIACDSLNIFFLVRRAMDSFALLSKT